MRKSNWIGAMAGTAISLGVVAAEEPVKAGGRNRGKSGGWKNIADIAASRTGTWALKADGTCIYTGWKNQAMTEDVAKWNLGTVDSRLPRVPRGRSQLLPWPGK